MIISEIPLEKFVQDITNIYYYIYLPEHECATLSGKVYMHRYVMSRHLGRLLSSDEAVHHKDEDRTNNDISNLELLSMSEHAIKHAEVKHGPAKIVACSHCGFEFKCPTRRFNRSKSGKLFCSQECTQAAAREFDVEVLRDLVWCMPTVKVAKILGVSDVAVAKRCKLLGIIKPPRGYWRKVETGTLNEQNSQT